MSCIAPEAAPAMATPFAPSVTGEEARAYAAAFTRPLAILHGEGEQLVSLDYLRTLRVPTLWRHQVQLIPGAGHAPHQETSGAFTALLGQFLADLS